MKLNHFDKIHLNWTKKKDGGKREGARVKSGVELGYIEKKNFYEYNLLLGWNRFLKWLDCHMSICHLSCCCMHNEILIRKRTLCFGVDRCKYNTFRECLWPGEKACPKLMGKISGNEGKQQTPSSRKRDKEADRDRNRDRERENDCNKMTKQN